jgi:2-keto-4-pentenoate hydratase
MSKQSTSRLTASRKKRRRQSARTVKAIGALNGLADCHYKLAALAGLLEACGETMEAGQVSSAGSLVGEQVRRLEELMTTLDQETR